MKITTFKGINNRKPIDRLGNADGAAFVRDAVNVDLSEVGTFQRRAGQERVIEAENCRSMFETPTGFYYAAGLDLMFFNGSSIKVGDVGSPLVDVAYAETPLGVAWSDGFTVNVITASGSRLLHPALPNPMPVAAAGATGALRAGGYGVSFATVLSDGRRSELSFPQNITVPEGGSITIAAAGHTQPIAVFVTTCDGTILYREADIAVGQTSAVIPLVRADREPISYEVMAPLPPGTILGYHKGRLLSASGTYLGYSRAFDLGVHRPAYDFIPFPEAITLVAPVEAGVFVATASKTYFLPGPDIAQAQMVDRQPFGAVAGTLTRPRNEKGAMWFTPRGAMRATDDGAMQLLQDKDIAFDPAQVGASIVREENGLRTFVAALSTSGQTGGAVMGSYMDAEIINKEP